MLNNILVSNTKDDFKLETERLILRPLTKSDQDILFEDILSHPQVMYFSPFGPMNKKYTKYFIRKEMKQQKELGFSCLAIELKTNKRLIGYCGLMPMNIDCVSEIELGFRLSYGYWKQGFGFEAASKLKQYAIYELKLRRLVSVVEKDNVASVKLIEKLGFKIEKKTIKWGLKVNIYSLNI